METKKIGLTTTSKFKGLLVTFEIDLIGLTELYGDNGTLSQGRVNQARNLGAQKFKIWQQDHLTIFCNHPTGEAERRKIAWQKKLCDICLVRVILFCNVRIANSSILVPIGINLSTATAQCIREWPNSKIWRIPGGIHQPWPSKLICFQYFIKNRAVEAFLETGAHITCISKSTPQAEISSFQQNH